MKPASPEQSLFAEALQRETTEARATYLDAACGKDSALRRRVDALLLAATEAGDFLERPPTFLTDEAASTSLASELSEETGVIIGRYKLLEKIGEGGCGVVYMAEQQEPVRRRVALKIIKLGMDTRSVVARLEAERQALALMDHPNIAKVLDGGATQTGRPYFVMELVRGVRITEFCDEAQLPTRARLLLFVQVCQAVQHAHQKGIIHRDLKPSNILVTVNDGAPVPKVIDFGIAKAIGQRLTDKTLFTQFHSFIGTPAYLSPEQAEMSSVDIDTRSDIYSLGVLLYELLTGRTPFDGEDLVRSGLDAMRRTIRDQQPPLPSTRLTDLATAAARRSTPTTELAIGSLPLNRSSSRRVLPTKELICVVRGDLDWIVMKCLEKDRARRYETANGLAADVQRHLKNEPILARPPSRADRLRKLVRRHQATFAAIAAVAVVLLAGTGVSIWQAVRAQRGEARANAALADLRATAPVFAAQAHELAARGQFAEAIEKLDYAIQLRPDSEQYLFRKADLLECQLQFNEAARVYDALARLAPNDGRVRTHLALCQRLGSREGTQEELWNESLAELFVLMTNEQRSDAELKPIAEVAREQARKRFESLELFRDRSLGQRLIIVPGKLLGLDLQGTRILDLSPLQGLPIGYLDLSGCAVTDLGPLRRVPLIQVNLSGTGVANLDPLRGMLSLRELSLRLSAVTNLAALQRLPLRWLDLDETHVVDLGPLRGMRLATLRLRNTLVADLTPLAGMPLGELDCTSIPAVDFSPLAACTMLTHLWLSDTTVKDLAMLQRCKLRELRFDNTAVRDLSPLAGMPLTLVQFCATEVTDVMPLLQCPTLQAIGLSRKVRNAAVLRSLPNLRRVSYRGDAYGDPAQTAAEFWESWDAGRDARK